MFRKILSIIAISSVISSCTTTKHNAVQNLKLTQDDKQLLNLVQKQTLKYFWDFAEPQSLLARERFHPDGNYPQNDANVVTTGGSGFGLMSILVGVENGFIDRSEAVKRLSHMAKFLQNADRYKGAFPHWINGETGKTVPFGKKDNGGDLVETAFLMQGLICVREYFKYGTAEEKLLAKQCDDLWRAVEWNWYTKGGEKVLYWHWSPEYNWDMNFPLKGYDETLITYILAASSPAYSIDKETYEKGWARDGRIVAENSKYNLPLYVKHNGAAEYGGPLFWSQYSYLALDPRGLSDQYVNNYYDLNRNHVLINYNYAKENPKKFAGYGENYWGLTASYTRNKNGTTGYTAHQPNNDTGVITPTAALSSFPYTPKESLQFLRFVYQQKPEFVGVAGPYDATSVQYNNWAAKQYLAIDQGTISPMIENYRSGFLWDLFMNAPDIRAGLQKLGFKSTQHNIK